VADVVGYSAKVQRDEVGTVQTVKGHISAFEPNLALHHGRIVKKTGDGFVAEFTSVVEAVACAVELQKTATERNQSLGSGDQTVFRIGIHTGDIIEDDNDIFGDGVNIASRLEGIAAPGSIAISAKVFEDVDGRLDLAFKDRGLKTLKNIQRPLKVFEIEVGTAAVPQRPQPDLPDKPSIAILPLQTFSGNIDDEFLADGLTEDLTILHYAEYLSDVPSKQYVQYEVPILEHGHKVWHHVTQMNRDAFVPGAEGLDPDYLEQVIRAYLETNNHAEGRVGAAQAFLFEMAALVPFAVRYFEERFG